MRLDQGDALDEAVDSLLLAEDAGRKELPHLIEVQRRLGVDDMQWEPGGFRKGLDHLMRPNLLVAVVGERRLQEPHDAGRRTHCGEVMLREIVRLVDRCVVDVRADRVSPLSRDGDDFATRQRLQT